MPTSHVWSVLCIAGGLVAITALPVAAQHSSGGTPPGVTEGKGGSSSAQSGEAGQSGQGQARPGDEQSPIAPGARTGRSSSDQGAKDFSRNMEMGRESSGEQRGTSMSEAQRSGGSQGTQEQMYEDRMKGVQEQSTQGTKKP